MMRNFTFPEVIPPELAVIRYIEGVVASGEYFDAVIQKIVSMLKSQATGKKIADELLYVIKQKTAYIKFSTFQADDGLYIQASYEMYPNISNLVGVCMQMLDESPL